MSEENEKRLSFSGYSTWKGCSYRYKLEYVDGHRERSENIYVNFGSAIHNTLEHLTNNNANLNEIFEVEYDKFINENKHLEDYYRGQSDDDNTWKAQGYQILDQVRDFFDETFPGYEIVSSEEEIFIPIEGTDWKFYGFADIIIAYKKKFWILDFKSTSYGWNRDKKQDPIILMQPQLYKYFWCQKHDANHKDVNIGFLLLKRTVKKDNIELFRASGSPAKLEQAAIAVKTAILNIERERWLKNRLSCKYCPFYKTDLCT